MTLQSLFVSSIGNVCRTVWKSILLLNLMVKSPYEMLVTPDNLLRDRPETDSVLILTTRFQPCQLKKWRFSEWHSRSL